MILVNVKGIENEVQFDKCNFNIWLVGNYPGARFEIDFKFRNMAGERLKTKLLNEIKKDDAFRELISNEIVACIGAHYPQLENKFGFEPVSNHSNRWHSYLVGNKVQFRLDINGDFTQQELIDSAHRFIGEFLASKVSCNHIAVI